VPSPNPGSGYNILNAVSCASSAACTAVGYDRAGIPFHNVIESWNGTTWSVVPGPTPPGPSGGLNGVSCVSAAACVAVGSYGTSTGANKALIESWNGTSWSVVPSPHPASSSPILYGVSCVSAAGCTAVGSDYPLNSGHIQTFDESWNGTKWSVVPSPSPASEYNVLSAVSCVSAAACTAVGSQYDTPTEQRTLAESWNGAAWSVVPSPNRPSGNILDGVSCVSAAACTAVGFHGDRRSTRSLVESWNGTKWSVTHSPSPGTRDMLNGVSCASAATCTAAGSNAKNSQSPPETLIETGH
jgi:hypothetical protein